MRFGPPMRVLRATRGVVHDPLLRGLAVLVVILYHMRLDLTRFRGRFCV